MANPFNNLNPINNYNMGNIKDMYKMMNGNPMQLIENLASRNPNFKPILDALRGGANPQQVFESMCKQRGINPQEFLRSIQGKI